MSENLRLATEGARELHLDLGPGPEAPVLRIPTLSCLERHPAGVPGTTLAQAILPWTWSGATGSGFPSGQGARLPHCPFYTGQGSTCTLPALTVGERAQSLVCFKGAMPAERPKDTCVHHQVLSWTLKATGRSGDTATGPLPGADRRCDTSVSCGPESVEEGLEEPGWAAWPAPLLLLPP